MISPVKTGIATTMLAIASLAVPAAAADLGRGSLKDGYVPAAPVAYAPTVAGPCYLRTDVGYSWSRKPHAEWTGNEDPSVRGPELENGYLLEGGLGCGMGSRGFRGELTVGARESRRFRGDVDVFINNNRIDPPITTEVKSYTMMVNTFYDLGKVGGFVPYVGAGIGWAYHKTGDTRVAHAQTPNVIHGEDKLSFAWALMAGVGYQLTERAVFDLGYRYIDLGLAETSHSDSVNAWNPRLSIDDQRAHEIKIGLRYHLGTSDCCAQQYVPMK